MDSYEVKPTHQSAILGGKALLFGFGPGTENLDWSLRGLQAEGDEEKPENTNLASRLGSVSQRLRLSAVLAPSPVAMNSKIVRGTDLGIELTLPYHEGNWVTPLWRGQQADGVRLEIPGEAFAMSAADCALVVVEWNGQMWAAHAGRDSLLDRTLIETGKRSKEYRSVVDTIMFRIPSTEWKHANVYYGCTISKGPHFEHLPSDSEWGEKNKKMLEYIGKYYGRVTDNELDDAFWTRGQIDMRWLIRRQFEQFGVTKFETDTICTYSDTDPSGNHVWHSNRRDKKKRNLFMVVRR